MINSNFPSGKARSLENCHSSEISAALSHWVIPKRFSTRIVWLFRRLLWRQTRRHPLRPPKWLGQLGIPGCDCVPCPLWGLLGAENVSRHSFLKVLPLALAWGSRLGDQILLPYSTTKIQDFSLPLRLTQASSSSPN